MPNTETDTILKNPADSADSLRFAEQIQNLKETELPDDWYSSQGATLSERFEATAKAMRALNPKAPSGEELLARYDNSGKPFMHSVWFNRPLRCPKCNNAGADGFYTVGSVRLNLVVKITAAEMHAVTTHQGAFAPEKLELLRKMLPASGK